MKTTTSIPRVSIQNAFLAFNQTVLFQNLNLELKTNEWTCLLGPSGIGKSSLLRLIANLHLPKTEAHASIVCDLDGPLANHIAYMGQSDALLPWLTALDNVLLGSRLRHNKTAHDTENANQLLELVGLSHAKKLYPHELSGGMKQRVAIARTLFENKPIILMDEPFTSLDTVTRYKLQDLAVTLLKNRTVFFITHDPLEALRLADEIYIMSGKPATIHRPINLYSPTPRSLGTTEMMKLEAALFSELVNAYEASQ